MHDRRQLGGRQRTFLEIGRRAEKDTRVPTCHCRVGSGAVIDTLGAPLRR
ncbi:MAG: hypothetical protein U0802_05855 [Candidatus Binatia bacterium]